MPMRNARAGRQICRGAHSHSTRARWQAMDVSEQLLSSFKTPWRPAVTEYYGSLLAPTRPTDELAGAAGGAAAGAGDEGGTKLWKSDLYVLTSQCADSVPRARGLSTSPIGEACRHAGATDRALEPRGWTGSIRTS